jgi:YHS domain-containing protein
MFRFVIVYAMLACLIASCKNETHNQTNKIIKKTRSKPFNTNIINEIIIDTNLLASKKDLVCYMPLWTGIGDTCFYKGKIYGFCSKDCKNDFLKNPLEYIIK